MTKEQVRFQVAVSVIQGIIEGKHGIIGEVVPAAAVDEAFRIADQFTEKWFEKYEGERNGVTESKALSDDEKTRKALIELVYSDVNDLIGGVEKRLCVSYLEKQKDEVQKQFNLGVQAGREEVMYEMEKEQKPAEWSLTDATFIEEIDETLFMAETGRNEVVKNQIERERNWIKSLPERFNPQPKQEWSEEDKKMLPFLDSILEYAYDNNPRGFSVCCIDAKNWLNSLRPQPHWKPSKEQMDALETIINSTHNPNHDICILRELYNDLKKL